MLLSTSVATLPQRPIKERKLLGETNVTGKNVDVDELREQLEPHVAEHGTEEAKEKIKVTGTSGKVKEIWEDGEVTMQKGGSGFRRRNMFRKIPPFLSEHLWEVPDGRDHVSVVVIDEKEALEIIQEAREKSKGN